MFDQIKKWFKFDGPSSANLKEPGEAYGMLFERSPLPQAITTRQGIYLEVNNAFCALHDIKRTDLIGKNAVDVGFCSAADLEQLLNFFRDQEDQFTGYLLKYSKPNGMLIFVRAFAHTIRFNENEAILIALDDITEQRLAERKLKESQQFVQTVLDNIPTRVFWKDKNSVFLGCNKMAAHDVGLSSATDIIGKTDFDFVEKPLAETFISDDQDVMTNGREKLFFEEARQLPDGSNTWKLTSKLPLRDESGNVIGLLGTYDDITQRKRVEADLKLASFSIEQATSSILWIAKTGRIIDFNPAFSRMLGFTRKELLKLSIHDIDPLYTEEKWQRHWDDLRQHQVLTFFTQQRRKDAEILDVEVRAHFLDFEGQEYNCVFINDVTSQKNAEKTLHLSHQFQQTVLNNIPAGVFWKDRRSRYLGGNAMFRTIANIREDEDFIGKSDLDFPWFAQAEQLQADDKYVMDNNIAKLYYVEPLMNADGKVHYNEVSKVPLINITGDVVGVLGTFRDITEQKEIELALKENERLLLGVVQNANAIIYVIDNEGVIKLSEGLGLAALGVSPGQLKGQSVFEIFRDAPEMLAPFRRALTGEAYDGEAVYRGITFSSRFTPMRNDSGDVASILCVSFDITTRKKMELELNELNNELERRVARRTEQLQQANNDLEAFAYSVSHDLRAPIRHIDGFSKLMYGAIPNPNETITQHYQRIIESSRRMSSMVDDLLSFARLGSKPITKTIVDLDAMMNNIIHRLTIDVSDREIKWIVHPMGAVRGDNGLLQLAFENLLSNAVKYTSPRDISIIEIGGTKKGKALEVYIKDNGVGFDMDFADKLFGVFQRLHSHEEFEGTGIGLANARQIVLKHKGKIRAEGKLDKGATFFITIPIN